MPHHSDEHDAYMYRLSMKVAEQLDNVAAFDVACIGALLVAFALRTGFTEDKREEAYAKVLEFMQTLLKEKLSS